MPLPEIKGGKYVSQKCRLECSTWLISWGILIFFSICFLCPSGLIAFLHTSLRTLLSTKFVVIVYHLILLKLLPSSHLTLRTTIWGTFYGPISESRKALLREAEAIRPHQGCWWWSHDWISTLQVPFPVSWSFCHMLVLPWYPLIQQYWA